MSVEQQIRDMIERAGVPSEIAQGLLSSDLVEMANALDVKERDTRPAREHVSEALNSNRDWQMAFHQDAQFRAAIEAMAQFLAMFQSLIGDTDVWQERVIPNVPEMINGMIWQPMREAHLRQQLNAPGLIIPGRLNGGKS